MNDDDLLFLIDELTICIYELQKLLKDIILTLGHLNYDVNSIKMMWLDGKIMALNSLRQKIIEIFKYMEKQYGIR